MVGSGASYSVVRRTGYLMKKVGVKRGTKGEKMKGNKESNSRKGHKESTAALVPALHPRAKSKS